ncbi:MAG: hypothetical protein ACE37F_04215 [Nannocystaceae bacterium]|nr:hypothetical protein [bacterium]
MNSVIIESRYNGPDGSANGGYACGLVAGLLEGDVTVRLRAKPPLDTPLSVVREGSGVELHDGEMVVAQGFGSTAQWDEIPAAPSLDQARAAQARYTGFHAHVFPRCFVCGPEREDGDGLRLFAGPVEGRDLAACSWTPSAAFARADGTVDPVFLWAALDCPSFFGMHVPYDKVFLLAEMSAALRSPVAADAPLVVYGWGRRIDGRKHFAGSAIANAEGTVLAHAQHLWIEARPG